VLTGVTERNHVRIRPMTSAKSLRPDQRRRVLDALAEVVAREGSQKRAAVRLGVSQQTVNGALNDARSGVGKGPGVLLATRIAGALGRTFEEIVDGAPAPAVRYRELPGWADAVAQVIALGAHRRRVCERAGDLVVAFAPARVDARLVLDVCTLWLAHAPLDERARLETDEAREDLERAGH